MIFDIVIGRSMIPGLYALVERIREFFVPKLKRRMKELELKRQQEQEE